MNTPAGPVIARDARVYVVATTDGGKSTLIEYYVRQVNTRILIIDVNDAISWTDDGTGVQHVRDVDNIDPSKRVTIYVPRDPEDRAPGGEYDRLFEWVWTEDIAGRPNGPGITVWLDETYGPTSSQQAPPNLKKSLKQGRKYNQRMLYAAQRPVDVWPDLKAMASDIIVMAQPLPPRDEKYLADELGFRQARAFGHELRKIAAQYKTSDDPERDVGIYAFLHWQRKTRRIYAMPPVPIG